MNDKIGMIRKTLVDDEEGFIDPDLMARELLEVAFEMVDAGDPTLCDAVPLILACESVPPSTIGTLAFLSLRAIRDDTHTLFSQPSVFADLPQLFVEHARVNLQQQPLRGAEMVGSLPQEICTLDLVEAALLVSAKHPDLGQLHLALIDRAIRVGGPGRAYAALVAPHLAQDSTESANVLITAYLNRSITDRKARVALRDRIMEVSSAASTTLLLRLVQRLSIDSQDEDAAIHARVLQSRDELRRTDTFINTSLWLNDAIIATVLWLAGERAQAADIARRVIAEGRSGSWFEGARWSLLCAIHAQQLEPHEVIELLAAGPGTERPGMGIETVGALVARLAVLRMHAYLALGDERAACREAFGVIFYHWYRDYDLHMQGAGYEFDVEFVSRWAVTPDEVFEAKSLVERLGGSKDSDAPHLFEGRLIPPSQW